MHPTSLRAAHDVRVVVGRLRRRLREVAGDDQLTPTQSSALGRLMHDGAMTASALAAAEGVRPQSMAVTVSALEERGLVVRVPDPDDGRRQTLTLTDAASDLVHGSRRTKEEWLARSLDELTEAERQQVIAAMSILEHLA